MAFPEVLPAGYHTIQDDNWVSSRQPVRKPRLV
jgi:hypothetical protein